MAYEENKINKIIGRLKMKDKDLNLIGRLWLCYCHNVKDFNREIDAICDVDLYSLYSKRDEIKNVLNRLIKAVEYDIINVDFNKFANDVLKSINDIIYRKEVQEKYDEEYNNR